MSRQLDAKLEERETARRDALVRVLEYGLVGAMETQGIELLGFAIKHDAFNCLMTIKAVVGGVQSVAFVGSDSIMNCLLKSESAALRDDLRWRPDKYHNK